MLTVEASWEYIFGNLLDPLTDRTAGDLTDDFLFRTTETLIYETIMYFGEEKLGHRAGQKIL